MFHISSLIVLFLIIRSRTFLEIRIKFHLGRTKGRGKRWGMGREAQNEVGFFLQNSHYQARYKLYLMNCWSDTLLITTTVISMPQNLVVETSSDFEQFFLVKNHFVCAFLRDKYGCQIGNVMEKINSVLILSLNRSLSPSFSLNT